MKTLKMFFFLLTVTFSIFAFEEESDFMLFNSNVNTELVQKVANQLNIKLSEADIGRFNDGEIRVNISDNVRGKNVYIIHSTCPTINGSVNDHLMELYLFIRALKRSSVQSITAVIPYFGYARQDRKEKPRVPISASDVAMFLERAGVDRVLSVDLHCGQIQGFFHKIPVDNLFSTSIFAPYIAKLCLDNLVIVAPDAGAVERVKKFREALIRYNCPSKMAIIIKQRAQAGKISQVNLVGDVRDCNVVIVDDICDTAGTLTEAAKELVKFGAKKIYACITHPLFSGPALDRIEKSVFEEIIVTDTIPLKTKMPAKVKQLSVEKLLAKAIVRIYNGSSLSDLFVVMDEGDNNFIKNTRNLFSYKCKNKNKILEK